MKPSERSWLVVVLAAVGATAVPGIRGSAPAAAPAAHANPRAAAKAAGPTSRAARNESVVETKLHLLLDDALGFKSDDEDLGVAVERYRLEKRGEIFTLVATVPDPELTTFDSFFDQELDAIRGAARAAGFGPDRFYLPWESPSGSENTDLDIQVAPDSPAGASAPIRVKHHKDDAAEHAPGILIFRRPPDPTVRAASTISVDLLVVFVVGESLPRGIRRAAFAAALEVSDRLRSSQLLSHQLLAPFFSASVPSLRLALASHADHCWLPNVVISGSANAAGLRSDALGDWPQGSSFHTTNRSVGELHKAIVDLLHDGKVAQLVEGTAWGESIEEKEKGKDNDRDKKIPSFVFPLHVSELRAEHERLKQGGSGDKAANLRTTLELRLDHGRDSADDLPIRAALTPYNVELMLHQQLATIARENFTHLGIVATDPADVIFLAGEARKYCPGVQLFALESNLLFAHPDVMAELNGMLVASTYPLLSDRTFSADRALDALTFASQSAEGIFNATSALLLKAQAVPDGKKDSIFRNYRQPSGEATPSIWVTMVHNGSLWPLQVSQGQSPTLATTLRASDKPIDSVVYSPGLSSRAGSMTWRPRVGKIVEGVHWLLSIVVAIWLLNLARRSWSGRRFPSVNAALKVDRVRYLLGSWAPLALFSTYLASIFWHISHRSHHTFSRHVIGWVFGMTMTAGAVSVVLLLSAWQFPRWAIRLRRRWWDIRNSALPTLVAGLAVATLAVLAGRYIRALIMASEKEPSIALAVDRTLQPLGGVSPGLPLLFLTLGFFCWGHFGLCRVSEQERFPDSTPFPSSERLASAGLGALAERIRAAHTPGLISLEHLFAFAFTALLAVYFNGKLQPTLEHSAFDHLFRVSFLLLLVLTATNAGRLVAAWRELRRLLRRLAGHPMADAYDRIGPRASSGSGWQLGGHVPGFDELEAAVRSGTLLARAEPPFADRKQAEVYWQQIKIEAELATGIYTEELGPDPLDPRVGTRAALFRLARTIFSALERLWEGDSERAAPESVEHLLAEVIPSEALAAGPYRHVHTMALYNRLASPGAQMWQRLAEDFVACQVVALLHLALGRLRAMMTFGMVSALILVCVGASYPFQPSRFVTVFTWSMALTVMGAILTVVVAVERDEVLSRIAQTRPGHVEFNGRFVSQVAVYGALPVAALVATNFPAASAVLLSWIEPLLRALH